MEESINKCLNCSNDLNHNFCEKCGQKSSTKRFSLKQIFGTDFLLGLFSLEKGFLYTLKSIFTRPGHFVREYIQGKRVTYFHFLTFLLIIVAVSIFIEGFSSIGFAELISTDDQSKKMMSAIADLAKENPRIVVLLQIPIYAFISFIWFLKAKQNFAEHIILNTYKASGELIIGIVFTIITLFYKNISVLWYIYNIIIYGLIIIFVTVLYFQYFNKYYPNKLKFVFRILLSVITAQIVVSIILGILGALKLFLDGRFEELI